MSGSLSWMSGAERIPVRTAAEVRQAIAAAGKVPLVPTGNGSLLRRGDPPPGPARLLDLSLLNQVLAYEAEDMTVTVNAGTAVKVLEETLREKNQWLPVDPFSRGSVGGLIAADRRCPLAGSLGSVRDYLIGVAFVDGRGREVRAGGRVVKNVAGYDLMKPLIGSLGTFGVITEASFKVLPRPEVWGGVILPEPTPEEMRHSRMELARKWDPTGLWRMDSGEGDHLMAVFAGSGPRVQAQVAAFREAWGERGRVLGPPEVPDRLERDTRWREDGDAALGWGGALPAFLGEQAPGVFPSTPWTADLLRGHFWCRLQPGDGSGMADMRGVLRTGEGHLHVDGVSGGSVWGRDPGPEVDLWRRIKEALDPDRHLVHGRLPGGV